MQVQLQFFEQIKLGTKTVEGRLNSDKWGLHAPGDIMYVTNPVNDEQIMIQIVAVRKYYQPNALRQFLANEMVRALPGVATVEEGMKIYHQFWDNDKIEKYGMVALEINKNLTIK